MGNMIGDLRGDLSKISSRIDFSGIGMEFTEKPVIVGGLAMEFYGLRDCGDDIDVIICDADYQKLASMYPDNRVDTWGDLCVEIDGYSFMRSISRLGLDFYGVGAWNFDFFKVISFERLFFMTGAAVRSEPDVQKRIDDFGLALGCVYSHFRNKVFVEYAECNVSAYESAPNGTIYGGNYED